MDLNPRESYCPVGCLQDGYFLPNFYIEGPVVQMYCRQSIVIVLSVNMAALRGQFSVMFNVSVVCSALTMASCSAWLLEHFLFSMNFSCAASSFPPKTATPDPTLCQHLLPSVRSLFPFLPITLNASSGRDKFVSSTSGPIKCFWLPFPFSELYSSMPLHF